MKFDHLGIIVPEPARGRAILQSTFGVDQWSEEICDPGNGVYVQFGWSASHPRVELVWPFGPASPIAEQLTKGKAHLNHLAYRVPSIDEAREKLRQSGCVPVTDPRPAVAFGGARIQFFLTPLRYVVELIESD